MPLNVGLHPEEKQIEQQCRATRELTRCFKTSNRAQPRTSPSPFVHVREKTINRHVVQADKEPGDLRLTTGVVFHNQREAPRQLNQEIDTQE